MKFVFLRGVAQDPAVTEQFLHCVNLDLVTSINEVTLEARETYPTARSAINFVGGGPILVVQETAVEILSMAQRSHLQ